MPPGAGPPQIQQRFSSPSVYLDHWAVMQLSEDVSLSARFTNALQLRRGTLLLWALNLAEFRNCSIETAERAEAFLEAALPSAYFTTMDLEQVLLQEQVPRTSANTLAPPPDLEMLQFIASRSSSLAQPYTMRGLLRAVVESDRLQLEPTFTRIAKKWSGTSQEEDFADRARTYKAPSTVPRTQAIMAELLRPNALNNSRAFDANDAADLMHAVISTSMCDYVLLDGDWEDRVAQLSQRGRTFIPSITPARCYSDRRDGLRRFVGDLESSPLEWPQLFPP